jgi:hypothetical protein
MVAGFSIATRPQQQPLGLDTGGRPRSGLARPGAEERMTIRIAMWSGPRNISTAMMRAWGSRADTVVIDEPFYAAYLATTGLDHPMRDRILSAHPTGWQAVARDCAGQGVAGPCGAAIVYQKHMAQHMVGGAPLDWMAHVRHAFLIRPPAEVAASFREKWRGMQARDLGFARQAGLFDRVRDLTGRVPPVIEARDVLEHPEGMLRALCAALGVPFDPAMLSWAPGPRATDGVWGAHWYEAVNRSTGFARPRPAPSAGDLPAEVEAIVQECQPHYDRLAAVRLRPAGPPP